MSVTAPATPLAPIASPATGYRLRVQGLVQGVGFRPFIWRLARAQGLDGWVRNDAQGVLIALRSDLDSLQRLIADIRRHCPPLARIESITTEPWRDDSIASGFAIIPSGGGAVSTGIVPDAASCADCVAELHDPANRRYRYPFINCTHCGPRLSIVEAIPYDRAHTSMSVFPLCDACAAEYHDPADRRFHAQPTACPDCGPSLWLEDARGRIDTPDPLAAAVAALRDGRLLAIKGIGGFHLACDAASAAAVAELRRRKRRPDKPLAMMATLAQCQALTVVDTASRSALLSPAAPVVLLAPHNRAALPSAIAPGQALWGLMLPHSPLHHLLLDAFDGPLVMTSGNPAGHPPCIDNDEARRRLAGIADRWLLHDRAIVNRVDDSVLQVSLQRGQTLLRPLRRARGLAPAPLRLPAGFEPAPPLLAVGAELKSSFCLLGHGQAIVSQHIGDLEQRQCLDDFEHQLSLYRRLFEHRPDAIVVDRHPDYLSRQHGLELAERAGIPLIEAQHHHAHIAACLGDNQWPLQRGPVIGLALDGLGIGDDGELWGGECLLADYRHARRLGRLRPAALPGGAQAMRQPWRNLYARLLQHPDWPAWQASYRRLALMQRLQQQPLAALASMVGNTQAAPPSSSCGRLFDAVAAATGLCFESQSFEGQAAMLLEAQTSAEQLRGCRPYRFTIDHGTTLCELDPLPLWPELLDDLARDLPLAVISARFHRGLADGWAAIAIAQAQRHGLNTIALSGGVCHNRLLSEQIERRVDAAGLSLLQHRQLPANDGGLSLGQALIGAATLVAPHPRPVPQED